MRASNTSQRLNSLMTERGLKQVDILNQSKEFQEKLGITMGKSALSQYVNGKQEPDQHRVFLLAKTLNVNEAWLMGFDVPREKQSPTTDKNDTPYYKLTEKEKLDIGKEVDKLLEGMYSSASVNFYGEPMTDEGKEKLRVAIQMAMELNKEKAKKKFTPKKYRNE